MQPSDANADLYLQTRMLNQGETHEEATRTGGFARHFGQGHGTMYCSCTWTLFSPLNCQEVWGVSKNRSRAARKQGRSWARGITPGPVHSDQWSSSASLRLSPAAACPAQRSNFASSYSSFPSLLHQWSWMNMTGLWNFRKANKTRDSSSETSWWRGGLRLCIWRRASQQFSIKRKASYPP